MNFLALVQEAERQSGTVSTVLSSVAGQSGRHLKFVNWVSDAWVKIQNRHTSWRWMRKEFSGALVANTARYTANSWSITDWARWVQDRDTLTIYLTATGVSDEGALNGPMPWHDYRRTFERGTQTAQRPTWWAISPQDEVCFGAKPDAAYTVRGEYYKTPQVLSGNTDTPECPDRFHMAIVWRALQLMAEHDEAPPTIATANYNFREVIDAMELDQLPRLTIGARPIA